MSLRLLNLAALVLLLGLLALNSRSVIATHERGVLLRFGEVVAMGVGPGVVWRLPLLETVERVDLRTRFSDLDRQEFSDARGDAMRVDAWVVWRVRELPRYYIRAGADPVRVAALLQPALQEGLQRAFAAAPWPVQRTGLPPETLAAIVRATNERLGRELGIELLSLQVKRVAFVPAVEAVVLDRMRLARDAEATALRAEALAQAAAVREAALAEQRAVLAGAEAQAARLRGEATVEAAALLTAAAAPDPALARYWRAVDAWRRSFGKPGDVFVLAADSELAALRRTLHLDKAPAARQGGPDRPKGKTTP